MDNIMTVRAPADIRNSLTDLAKQLGIPRNALILQILREWVKAHE